MNVLIENFEKHQRPSIGRDWNFPVNLSDINKFENHNSTISVNVFGYEKLVYPLRISQHNSTLCHICNEELGKDKVHDHCHLSGKFRVAAYEVCNLKYNLLTWRNTIVVIS